MVKSEEIHLNCIFTIESEELGGDFLHVSELHGGDPPQSLLLKQKTQQCNKQQLILTACKPSYYENVLDPPNIDPDTQTGIKVIT